MGSPAKLNTGPLLGLKVFNVLAVTFVASYLVFILYGASIPGAGSMKLSFMVVALFLPVLLVYAWILYNAVVMRYFRVAALLLPLAALASFVLIESKAAESTGWILMRDELEVAAADNTCPDRVGLVRVEECTTIDGEPAFDFGTGATDQVLVTQAEHLPAGYDFERELTDGWRVVLYQR